MEQCQQVHIVLLLLLLCYSIFILGPVPTDKDAKAVMEYLTDNLGDEMALNKGLEQLIEITKEDGSTVNNDGKHVIGKIMNDYLVNEEIQTYSCQVLCNLAMTGMLVVYE